MFDMQQYSEAEMVFRRVETLAKQQNLPDWAEMAVQNIELAQQTLAEQTEQEEAGPEEVGAQVAEDSQAPESAVYEEGDEAVLEVATSEENKSIEDIGNIAAVAQIPETESESLAAQAGDELPVETALADGPTLNEGDLPLPRPCRPLRIWTRSQRHPPQAWCQKRLLWPCQYQKLRLL